MAKVSWLMAGLAVLFAAPAHADAKPFHSFRFNAPAGFIERDSDVVGQKLLSGSGITGEVMLVRCEETEAFGAGFRMEISPGNEQESYYVGFSCVPDTGVLTTNSRYRKEGPDGSIIHEWKDEPQEIGSRFEVIPLTAVLAGNTIRLSFGDYSFEQDLVFEPKVLRFYGYGTAGVANFYEEADTLF